jgi:hypothetical protein
MELSQLRSLLTYYCPNLQNITIGDLENCKWQTIRVIYTELIATCPISAIDLSMDIEKLSEERGKELRLLASNDADRETRFETEKIFRTRFMRLVLTCLTELRWPPAIEPFSDPIQLLMGEEDTNIGGKSANKRKTGLIDSQVKFQIFASMKYIIQVGIAPYSEKEFVYDTQPSSAASGRPSSSRSSSSSSSSMKQISKGNNDLRSNSMYYDNYSIHIHI